LIQYRQQHVTFMFSANQTVTARWYTSPRLAS
jgi:hypothetical protein